MRPLRIRTATVSMLAAAAVLGGFVVSVSAAKPSPSLQLSVCLPDTTHVSLTMSWNAIRADQYSMGVGLKNGLGFGALSEPFTPVSSGTATEVFSDLNGQQKVELAGADLRLRGQVVASVQNDRPKGNWPACP